MAVKDLVSGVLAESITTSTTNILVHIADNISAQGITDFFPNPPFYITIMPKAPANGVSNRLDSEIIKITNVGHDQVGNAALTCVRGQRDTTAKAFEAGSIVTVGVYADDAVFLADSGVSGGSTYRKKLVDKDGNTIYPDVGVLETNNIADDAITADKIDWSSMAEDNNNIRKIYTAIVSGTTDENGFLAVDTNVIKPSNAIILGARGHGDYEGFYFPYSDTNQGRYTIRCLAWNFDAFGNSYRQCDIAYIKVN